MVSRLRPKTGAERIGVTIGDFATTRVEGSARGAGVASRFWDFVD
jgi:hypothetical protein